VRLGRPNWDGGGRGSPGWSNPAITAALHGFNKNRVVGGIPEGVAQPVDGAADAVIEVDEDPFRPERLAKLVAAEHLVGTAQKQLQGAKGQILNLDPDPILAEFAGAQVRLEDSEAHYGIRYCRWQHKKAHL
jgi:hypothetical protein